MKGAEKMTLEELAALPQNSVPPKVAAQFLGCQPYALNVAAKMGRLKIKHFFAGNRLHISKAAILDYCGYKGPMVGSREMSTVTYSRRLVPSSTAGWVE